MVVPGSGGDGGRTGQWWLRWSYRAVVVTVVVPGSGGDGGRTGLWWRRRSYLSLLFLSFGLTLLHPFG